MRKEKNTYFVKIKQKRLENITIYATIISIINKLKNIMEKERKI